MNFFKKNNSTDPYSFAVIGLTNSGKSTFLARLYGSSVINPSETGRDSRTKRSYLISFGLATETDERKSASLSAIKELWKNITTHSDREFRSKTSDKSFLTFKVEGGSIEGQRVVETADVPGETFRTEKDNREDEESVSAGVKDEDIRRFKDEFNRHCPKCNAALIIVAAETFDDPDANQLVKSAISTVGARNVNGCPIFKVIAVSKAASRIKEESRKAFNHNLRKFEKELCAATKTKGLIRCVACDALEDLVKDGDGWRLPKEGDPEKTLPRGVLTPSDVMKLFFDMEAAYYAKRRFKVAALAVLSTSLLLGAWCWQGLTADRHLFDDTMGQTADVRRKGLESYLKAPFLGRLYFPGRYFKSKACAEWRKVVFDRPDGTFYRMSDGNAANLDQKLAELDRIERDFCTVAGTQEIAALRDELNKAVVTEQGKWRVALSNVVEELHLKCASQGDLKIVLDCPEMPSLTNEVRYVLQDEEELYSKEEARLKEEGEKLSDRSNREKYCNYLNELAKRSCFIYFKHQEKRELQISNARDALDREVDERPYFVKEAAGKFKIISENFKVTVHDFGKLEKKADDQLQKLQEKHEDYCNKYNNAETSRDRSKICNAAISDLKDHPSISLESDDGWNRRKSALEKQINESRKIEKDLSGELNKKMGHPLKQIADVRGALDAKGSALSPEVTKRLEEKLKDYENQWSEASNAWMRLESAFSAFKKDGRKYDDCYKELEKYERLVCDVQNRNDGIEGYNHRNIQDKLKEEQKRTDDLKAEYLSHWGKRSKPEKEIESFKLAADKLAELLKTRHQDFAEEKVNEWKQEIARAKEDCQESSPDKDFERAILLLRTRRDYEDRLGLDKKGEEELNVVQELWDHKYYNETVRKSKECDTAHALDLWIKYFEHKDDGSWRAYRDEESDAMMEKKRLVAMFAAELKDKVVAVGKEDPRGDVTAGVFSERMKKLSGYEDDYLKRVSPDNNDGFKNALLDVRKMLRDRHLKWHKKCLDKILEKIPAGPSGFRVLTKWSQLDKIDQRLLEMSEEKSIVSMLPTGFHEKWKQKARKLEKAEFDLGLRVKSFGFKLTERGDGPTDFMPGFELLCRQGEEWHPHPVLHYDERKPKDDPTRLTRSPVTPGKDKHQYILFAGKSDEDFKEAVKGVKAGKELGLDFVFVFAKSDDGWKQIPLPLLTKGETPASLIKGEKDKFANEVYSLKYKDWRRHEYDLSEFKLEVELLDPSCLNDFLIPSTAEAFFKWIEK